MARYLVIQYNQQHSDSKYAYGISVAHAESPEEAVQDILAMKGTSEPLFAITEEALRAEAGPQWGNYDFFGPWLAKQLVARGIMPTDFYRANYLKWQPAIQPWQPPGPRKPPTEVEPFWWEKRAVNSVAAMDITRVLCGGAAKES